MLSFLPTTGLDGGPDRREPARAAGRHLRGAVLHAAADRPDALPPRPPPTTTLQLGALVRRKRRAGKNIQLSLVALGPCINDVRIIFEILAPAPLASYRM